MKRFLLIALVALLVVTGGVFAYTFTTATATIGVNAIESDFASVNTTSYSAPAVFGKFTGTWPSGTLFNISPYVGSEDYTGDLIIKVYLVNAGELIKAYHHLNMALEFRDSGNLTADKQGIEAAEATIQVLNLQNAEVLFEWEYASGNFTPPYKVDLTGGSYRLHPWKTLTGGSYQPQIWVEITQR